MTTHALVTLSNTVATRLTPNGQHSGMDITIQNTDDEAIVYLGGEGVTSSSYGFHLDANGVFSVELPGADAIYAISNTNGSKLSVLKFGLEQGS